MYGKGMVKSGEMNQHRTMAGAGMKGDFGVKALPQRSVPHPDVAMGTGAKGAMDDSMRGAKPGIGKGMAMQAAPDHGGMGPDHFKRGGSV